MSEVQDKPNRDRLVIVLAVLGVVSLACVFAFPALIFAIKFGWPRIRKRYYRAEP